MLTICRKEVLDANSISKIKFKTNTEANEGKLRGTDELKKKGVLVLKTTATDKEQFCYVHNISGEKVVLAKDSVIAHIISPVRETASIWTGYDPHSTDKKDKPVELKKSIKKELNQSGDQEEILVEQIQEMDSRSTNSPHRTKKTLNTEDTINDDWTVDNWLKTVRLTTGYIN